jgi:hypothetical protein
MDQELKPGQWQEMEDEPTQAEGSQIGRHVARTTARAVEGVLGVPGDLINLGLSGLNAVTRGVTGKWDPDIEKVQNYLPTTKNLREHVTPAIAKGLGAEEILTPQSDTEKQGDRFVSELTSILTPAGVAGVAGKGAKLGLKAVGKAAAIAGSGNAAGWLTRVVTGSEAAGDAVHGATQVLTSLGLNGTMRKASSKLYDELKESEAIVTNGPLLKGLKEASEALTSRVATKGGKALSTFLKKSALPLANKVSIEPDELTRLNKGLSSVLKQNPFASESLKNVKDVLGKALTGRGEITRPDLVDLKNGIDTLIKKNPFVDNKLLSMRDVATGILKNSASISVHDLIDLEQGLNTVIRENPFVDAKLTRVRDAIVNGLQGSMRQMHNPEFYQKYLSAKSLYAEANKSSKIQDFVKSVANSTATKFGSGTYLITKLFGLDKGHLPSIATAAAASVPLGALYGLGSAIKRIPGLSDPTIQRFYIQAIKAAANESRPGVIKALHSIEKYAKDKDFKEPEQEQELKPGQWQEID